MASKTTNLETEINKLVDERYEAANKIGVYIGGYDFDSAIDDLLAGNLVSVPVEHAANFTVNVREFLFLDYELTSKLYDYEMMRFGSAHWSVERKTKTHQRYTRFITRQMTA